MLFTMTSQLSAKLECVLKIAVQRAEAKAIYISDRGGNILAVHTLKAIPMEDNLSALAAGSFFATPELAKMIGEVTGEDAVFLILTLKDGQFEFARGNPPIPPEPLKKATRSLLLDGCRILDETKDIEDSTGQVWVKAIPIIRTRDTETGFRPQSQDCRKLPV